MYTDAETGLLYCQQRYYAPNLGRFLSRDPIGFAGGLNPYAYCEGDPINRFDPDGLDFVDKTPPPSFGDLAKDSFETVTGVISAPLDYVGGLAWDTMMNFTRPGMEAGTPTMQSAYMDDSKEVQLINGRYGRAGKEVRAYVDETGKMMASQAIGLALGAVSHTGQLDFAEELGLPPVAKKPHGNSLRSSNRGHVYQIWNDTKNSLHKYGESTGASANGKSARAEAQVKHLNSQGGDTYSSRILRKTKNKRHARGWEKKYIQRYTKRKGFRPPGNPVDR